MVDLPLAAELGLQRFDRQAVGLRAAVAAALAHQLVDDHALGGLCQGAALAPAALFSGAGLVVNDDGAAGGLAQLALQRVELVAVVHANACGQGHALVLARLVAHHHHAARAFGHHRVRNLRHAVALRPLANLLATRHGHRVVVENFVGDVHARRNRLANGQEPAVKVGAVAQVGKHMRLVHKGLLAHPGHALAAHLREACGGPVHPQRHVVAANAGHGTRALRHFGAGVVRAARAKPGRALGSERAHL